MTESIYASAYPKPAAFDPPAHPSGLAAAAPTGPAVPPTLSVPLAVLHLAEARDRSHRGRFDLRQVRFGRDAQGCYAVATDSKLLAVARWEEADGGEPCEIAVPGAMVAAAMDAASDLGSRLDRIEVRDGSITVTGQPTAEFAQSYTFADAAYVGRFPPWRDILIARQKHNRPEEGTITLRVDPVLWTRVGALFQAVIGDDGETSIRIHFANHQHPILYESAGPSPVQLTVLLMPLQGDR